MASSMRTVLATSVLCDIAVQLYMACHTVHAADDTLPHAWLASCAARCTRLHLRCIMWHGGQFCQPYLAASAAHAAKDTVSIRMSTSKHNY